MIFIDNSALWRTTYLVNSAGTPKGHHAFGQEPFLAALNVDDEDLVTAVFYHRQHERIAIWCP
ncbi:hypothetical protein [Candidatus Leptofilum sp.]|uniref:hypothetical protein n=1 Tax=Candidatus Leptofilum sp. TaxID=3241576 RepID=UPI003B5A2DD3